MNLEELKARFSNEEEFEAFCEAFFLAMAVGMHHEEVREKMQSFDSRLKAALAFGDPKKFPAMSQQRRAAIFPKVRKIELQYERMFTLMEPFSSHLKMMGTLQKRFNDILQGNGPVEINVAEMQSHIKDLDALGKKMPEFEKAFNEAMEATEEVEKEIRKDIN
jgi:hypothetical protein